MEQTSHRHRRISEICLVQKLNTSGYRVGRAFRRGFIPAIEVNCRCSLFEPHFGRFVRNSRKLQALSLSMQGFVRLPQTATFHSFSRERWLPRCPACLGIISLPSTSSRSNHHLFSCFGCPYPKRSSPHTAKRLAAGMFLIVHCTKR